MGSVIQVGQQPTLRFHSAFADPFFGSVTLDNVPLHLLTSASHGLSASLLQNSFQVQVINPGSSETGLPPISGRYERIGAGLRFIPHFPFERGLTYRAVFELPGVGELEHLETLTLNFRMATTAPPESTSVLGIYPTSDSLPENLLRFYVRFSQPMQRGFAGAEVQILGSDGKSAADVLYRAPLELWDSEMRCLTVLLDPGRLKRGVGPHRELGPPLRLGEDYTLCIGEGMRDFSGCRLPRAFHKRFRVSAAERKAIDINKWKIVPPAGNSSQPLHLDFPTSLDWALLLNTILILTSDRKALAGHNSVDNQEQRWSFTPNSPWEPDRYKLFISDSLEDSCGNNIQGAFERPLLNHDGRLSLTPIRTLDFVIR
jgi:hypothetical protein